MSRSNPASGGLYVGMPHGGITIDRTRLLVEERRQRGLS